MKKDWRETGTVNIGKKRKRGSNALYRIQEGLEEMDREDVVVRDTNEMREQQKTEEECQQERLQEIQFFTHKDNNMGWS